MSLDDNTKLAATSWKLHNLQSQTVRSGFYDLFNPQENVNVKHAASREDGLTCLLSYAL